MKKYELEVFISGFLRLGIDVQKEDFVLDDFFFLQSTGRSSVNQY